MGFLDEGNTMGFEELNTQNLSEEVVLTKKVAIDARSVVKRDGLKQMVNIIRHANNQPRHNILLWGDEVEMTCVEVPKCLNAPPKLWLGAYGLVERLKNLEKQTDDEWKTLCLKNCDGKHGSVQDDHRHLEYFSIGSSWHPEMSRHMIEALPNPPFAFSGNLDGCVLGIEESMNARRRKVQAAVPPHVVATTITAFPAMGGFEPGNNSGWLSPENETDVLAEPGRFSGSPSSRSRMVPDCIANPHPRFPTLVENIRIRRGGAYKILVPVYQDINTSSHPMWDMSLPQTAASNRKLVDHAAMLTPNPVKGNIYMDSFSFGMGTSCLQVTMGCSDIHDARHLYDQYVVLAPLILAITASTPAYRGLLAGTDTRWSTLEQGCDCRTEEEEKPSSASYIPKSRYSGVSLYLSDGDGILTDHKKELNDSVAPVNREAFEYLINEGFDEHLARHFAHLWIREPMVIYDNSIFIDNENRNDHFENLNSTNWNSVRFKPPPIDDSSMPYRVELRTAEVQLTDFENASIASFSAVFARAVIEEGWELYIPMTKNDENMHKSWNMDAVVKERFWFRTDISKGSTKEFLAGKRTQPLCQLMTMHQIMSGDRTLDWPGLATMMLNYVSAQYASDNMTKTSLKRFSVFCQLIKARASGEVPTCARYLRNIMTSHLHYNQDSVITPSMASRAMTAAALIGAGVFNNELSSVKPHLGRFVLDVKPLYQSGCGIHQCCLLQMLRKRVFEYEGIDGGSTPAAKGSRIASHNSLLNLNSGLDAHSPMTNSTKASEGGINEEELPSSSCNLEWMIQNDECGTQDAICSIHGLQQGHFQPTSDTGGYKNDRHSVEWDLAHKGSKMTGCCRLMCHKILKNLLDYGAELSEMDLDGFPCRIGNTEIISSPERRQPSVMHYPDSSFGPFRSTMAAKDETWQLFQTQLEHPDMVPEYLLRRREVEGRLHMP